MAGFSPKAALLVLALPLAGCMTTMPTDQLTPRYNPSLYSVNQPVVSRTDYVFDLASSGNGISPSELDRLDAWFASLNLGYGDRISIDQAGGAVDRRGADDVASVAADYGLLLSDGAPVTAGQLGYGTVRVVVSRSTASVPGCPMWDKNEIGARAHTSAPNFGCATNSNLAQMVADPSDLVLGRTGTMRDDPRVANKAVGAYRATPPSGAGGALKQESSKGN